MEESTDIFELRFDGNGVNPETVKPSEIAQLINDLQEVLVCQIQQDFPQVNTEELLFTFDKIKNESLGIAFKKKLAKYINEDVVEVSYAKIAKAVSTGNFDEIPDKGVLSLRNISKFTQRHNCNGDLKSKGKVLSTILPTNEIKEKKHPTLKGTTILYGEITDIGSNVHLKLNDGSTVYINNVDKQTSKQLATKLWEYVGVSS